MGAPPVTPVAGAGAGAAAAKPGPAVENEAKAAAANIVSSVTPPPNFFNDCFSCQKLGGRKICNLGGQQTKYTMLDGKTKLGHFDGACCTKDDKSPQCTPGTNNFCSNVWDPKDQLNWYSYCPHSSPTLAKFNHDCTDDGS